MLTRRHLEELWIGNVSAKRGNVKFKVRQFDRGLAADGRLVRFNCTVSDRPGGLAQMIKLLWDLNISVKVRYLRHVEKTILKFSSLNAGYYA